jgi:hypothetical protein
MIKIKTQHAICGKIVKALSLREDNRCNLGSY